MDEEQMQMGIEVLWWSSQAYPPQFVTLRCQNWPGEIWCCQSVCSENGVKMLEKMDGAQCRGVNADGDLMVINPDRRSLLDRWARVDKDVAGWWRQVGRPGQSIALDGRWERNLKNFGLGGGTGSWEVWSWRARLCAHWCAVLPFNLFSKNSTRDWYRITKVIACVVFHLNQAVLNLNWLHQVCRLCVFPVYMSALRQLAEICVRTS